MEDPGLVDDDSHRCKPAKRDRAHDSAKGVRLAARRARVGLGWLVGAWAMLGACGDNHAVSPWGPGGKPTLAPFREAPDLDRNLARTAEELEKLGLTRTDTYEVENDDVPFVAWRGAPADPTAWSRVSTRVITPYGIVFGAGPSEEPDRTQANDLAIPEGLDSPFFLLKARRRVLAVLLRAADAHLAVYLLTPYGSTEVPIEASAVPRRAVDLDGDGYVDLVGEIVLADPNATRLPVVAGYDGLAFDDRTDGVRAFHEQRANAAPREGTPPDVASAVRLWHHAAAGSLSEKEVGPAVEIAFAKRTEVWLTGMRDHLLAMARRQVRKKPPPPPAPKPSP